MKKYSKPIIQTEVITDINESVFLIGSSEWRPSTCYDVTYEEEQTAETGRLTYVFQGNATHLKDFTPGHANHGQVWLITFNKPLPSQLKSVTMNGITGYINGNTIGFITLYPNGGGWHQNGAPSGDHIGLGDLTLNLNFDPTWTPAQVNAAMNGIYLIDININDEEYRDYY